MFKIRRPAIIGLLVVLLVFTGYLNHQLTQDAQLKASKEYNKYELGKIDEMEDSDDVAVSNENIDRAIDKINMDLAMDKEDTDMDNANIDIIDSRDAEKIDASILETMSSEASMNSKNYFVEYRLSRDKLRGTLVERLDGIVNNENTNESSRAEAQKEIMKIGSISEKELQIEGLVKGKGYEDAIVFLTDKDIKVVVSSAELAEQDMVKILEIVKSETDYTMDNIKIMKKQ